MYTKLESVANGVADDGVAEVFEFGVGLAAHDARGRDVQVHVAAVVALHARRTEAGGDHQRLHFAGFDGTQYTAQSDGTASVAVGLADHIGDHLLLALFVVVLQQIDRQTRTLRVRWRSWGRCGSDLPGVAAT